MNQTFVVTWAVLAVSQVVYLLVPAPTRENASALPNVFPVPGPLPLAPSI